MSANCRVCASPVGWWVSFPENPAAVLLLDTDGDKIQFATDCGVDLEGRDLLLALDLWEFHECPESYYLQAQMYKEPIWG